MSPAMNSILKSIFGHNKSIHQLKNSFLKSKLPHALLFTGPDSIGKQLTALGLSQLILCDERTQSADEACGHCPSCIRVSKKQSENMLLISPEGTQIKIDQTRRIMEFLSLANFGRPRVILIDQCQLMNAQASNNLLKILEEPADNVYFILIAPSAESILSTIRSRCQSIQFSPLCLEDLKQIRPGLSPWMYHSSRGQVQRLDELSQKSFSEDRVRYLDLLIHFFNSDFLLNTEWKTEFKGREQAMKILRQWVLFLRDSIVIHQQSEALVMNSDLIQQIKEIKISSADKIFSLIDEMMKMEKDLQGYLDPVLLIEKLKVTYGTL